MTELERDLERALVRAVRQHGGHCLKWVSPGASGVPDRIVLLPGGRVVFVELKRPRGGRMSALQKWWAHTLIDLGFSHWLVWDRGDLDLFRLVELDGGGAR